jgi:transposase
VALFRFGSCDKPKPRGPDPVRATTAFKRLIDLCGVSVTEVGSGPDQVVVTVRLRSRRLACPLCGFTTRARYDLRTVASS